MNLLPKSAARNKTRLPIPNACSTGTPAPIRGRGRLIDWNLGNDPIEMGSTDCPRPPKIVPEKTPKSTRGTETGVFGRQVGDRAGRTGTGVFGRLFKRIEQESTMAYPRADIAWFSIISEANVCGCCAIDEEATLRYAAVYNLRI